jgi:hypothetical protein
VYTLLVGEGLEAAPGSPAAPLDPASNRVVLRARFSGFHDAYETVTFESGENYRRVAHGQPGGRLSPWWSVAKPEGVPGRMEKGRNSICRRRTASRRCACR